VLVDEKVSITHISCEKETCNVKEMSCKTLYCYMQFAILKKLKILSK